jgi:hypothetical protein
MKTTAESGSRNGNGIRMILKTFDPSLFRLIPEVGINFFRFLRSTGISHDSNMVVLSSRDSWTCNKNELKDARILVTCKKLNLIKHLDLFLGALVRTLPPDISLVGCFADHAGGRTGRGKADNFVHYLLRFLSLPAGRNQTIDRYEVLGLLEKNGFKTINMKDINGMTYFMSRNTVQAG